MENIKFVRSILSLGIQFYNLSIDYNLLPTYVRYNLWRDFMSHLNYIKIIEIWSFTVL